MTTFAYSARDASGRASTGQVVADDDAAALKQLRAEGKYVLSLKPASEGDPGGFATTTTASPAAPKRRGMRMARADLVQISQQLAIMIETGVNLVEALDSISAQSEKPNVRALVADLASSLQSGASLSDAMSRHPRAFPTLYLALIRASERSGMLPKLLGRATAYLRDEQETRRRVKGALTYPCIMFLFAISTTIFLLTFVLPKFTVIYANKKAALPLPTQVLMNASDFLIGHWVAIVVGVVLTAAGAFAFLRTSAGARAWHFVQLHFPVLGKLFKKIHLSRGLRMVGTMAGAGVSLMDCVGTAESLCENTYFRDLWKSVGQQLQVGRPFSEPLFRSPLVPRSVAQMLGSGEKSGKVAQVMEQVSTYAESELKDQIANLTRYIEPAMIVIMGLIIGGVALALLLPIFTISRVMAH